VLGSLDTLGLAVGSLGHVFALFETESLRPLSVTLRFVPAVTGGPIVSISVLFFSSNPSCAGVPLNSPVFGGSRGIACEMEKSKRACDGGEREVSGGERLVSNISAAFLLVDINSCQAQDQIKYSECIPRPDQE
jgi:hypothetical protein